MPLRKAIKWYRLAAEQDDETAKNALQKIFEQHGVQNK